MANIAKDTYYVVFPLSGTLAASADIPSTAQGGFIKRISFGAMSFSENVSGTPAVYDDDGNSIWSFGVCMSSTTGSSHYLTAADVPLMPGYSLRITLGGPPGSAGSLSATPLTGTIAVWTA